MEQQKPGMLEMSNKGRAKMAAIVAVSLAIGFLGGMEYKAYQVRTALKEISDVFDVSGEAETVDWNSATIIDRRVGDEVQLATVTLKINGAKEAKTVSTGFGSPVVAKEGATLVLVDVSVTNTTSAPFTFYSQGLLLVDQRGRAFETHSEWPDNYLDGRNLAPSITERGNLLFELPEDSTGYSFVAGKAGTDEVYKIHIR